MINSCKVELATSHCRHSRLKNFTELIMQIIKVIKTRLHFLSLFLNSLLLIFTSNLVYNIPIASPNRNRYTINFDHVGSEGIDFIDRHNERPVNSFEEI